MRWCRLEERFQCSGARCEEAQACLAGAPDGSFRELVQEIGSVTDLASVPNTTYSRHRGAVRSSVNAERGKVELT